MDRWIEVARRRRLETANALAEFVMDRCRRGDVALFGSRARGDFHDMSDWDIAAVVEDGEYAVAGEEFGQAVYIPVARLDQLLTFSMIILDVAHDGHLLCGKGDLWHEFVKKGSAIRYGEKAGKNRSGLVSIGLTAGSTRRLQRRDAQIAAPIGAAARRTKAFPSCRPCRRRGQHLSQNRSALEGGGRRAVGRGPATALGALMLAVRLNARGSRAAAEQQHRI